MEIKKKCNFASLKYKFMKQWGMNTVVNDIKEFDTVAFFRAVKEKIAKPTEGMSLQERRDLFQKIREGKLKLS